MENKQLLKTTGGKKLRQARTKIEPTKIYALEEAIKILKNASFAKFDETLEFVAELGVDPKHSDQNVRGVVPLPAGTGKNIRVAVICKDEKVEEIKALGVDMVGSSDIIDSIAAGNINFDICITTPDMMGAIGKVARILGPRGLMPNPKLGTVTMDIATAVKNAKSGQVEYRVEKAGIIHAGIGKISFEVEGLCSNANALVQAIIKSKPTGVKGTYLKAIFLSTTMGPSIRIDLSSIAHQ